MPTGLLKKGPGTLCLQVGGGRPKPDSTYGHQKLSETWEGNADEIEAKAVIGSAHDTYAHLKLVDFDPSNIEAGMGRVSLDYAGATAYPTTPKVETELMTKQGSQSGTATRNYEYVYWIDSFGSSHWTTASDTNEGNVEYGYRTWSISFYYTTNALPTGPAFESEAIAFLTGKVPTILWKDFRESKAWTPLSELFEAGKYRNEVITTPNISLETTAVILEQLQPQEIGVTGSGIYQVREAWSLLTAEAVA